MLCTYEYSLKLLSIIKKCKYINYYKLFGFSEYLKLLIKCIIGYNKSYYPPTDSYKEDVSRIDLG